MIRGWTEAPSWERKRGLVAGLGIVAAVLAFMVLSAASASASGPLTVKAISAGTDHTCALRPSGQVYCWGQNDDGQLGNGTLVDSQTPVKVKGVGGVGWLDNVTKLSAGAFHTCAARASYTLVCWGYNSNGQLGDGSDVSRPTPVEVDGFNTGADDVAAGAYHTCAIRKPTNQVACWGHNFYGQLGNGGTTELWTPYPSTSGPHRSLRARTTPVQSESLHPVKSDVGGTEQTDSSATLTGPTGPPR